MSRRRAPHRGRSESTRNALYFGTISAHFPGWSAGSIRTYVRYTGGDGRSGARACAARHAAARCARSVSSRRVSRSGSRRSCVRPTTRVIGTSAGCSSSAQWLAQISSSDHRTATAHHATPATRCASLPALDHALSTGALTLDQVAAAAEFATPAERCRARARRARQGAQCHRAGCAHDRPAHGGGRSGAV